MGLLRHSSRSPLHLYLFLFQVNAVDKFKRICYNKSIILLSGENMRKFFEYRIFFKYLFMYLCIVAAFILLLIPIYTTVYQVVKNNTVQNEADKVWENVSVLTQKLRKLQRYPRIYRMIPIF